MQNLQDAIIPKIVSYLLGVIGSLLFFGGVLAAYIYKSDKHQNGLEHGKLFEKTDDHGERISKIEGKLKM